MYYFIQCSVSDPDPDQFGSIPLHVTVPESKKLFGIHININQNYKKIISEKNHLNNKLINNKQNSEFLALYFS